MVLVALRHSGGRHPPRGSWMGPESGGGLAQGLQLARGSWGISGATSGWLQQLASAVGFGWLQQLALVVGFSSGFSSWL